MPGLDQPRPGRAVVVMLFMVSLAGRYTLDRTGTTAPLGINDLRVWGIGALAIAAFFWRTSQPAGYQHRWPASAQWMLALLGMLALAAFWAPPEARVGARLGDLAALVALLIVTLVVTGADPDGSARLLLWLSFGAAVLYAVAGISGEGDVQGRHSAFGGGPNVFARVVCIGILAALTLAVATKLRWPLLALPLLGTAAMLSGSRGALLSLVAAALVFCLLFARRLRPSLPVVGGFAGAAVAAGVWRFYGGEVGPLASERYSLATLQGSDYSSRLPLLSDAWRLFTGHIWYGGGMDVFYTQYGQFIGLGYVHNFPATVAAETGAAGVIIMVGAVLRWIRDGRPWRAMTPHRLGCAVLAGYVAVGSLFSGDYYDSRFAWLFAVVAVNRAASNQGSPDRDTGAVDHGGAQWIGTGRPGDRDLVAGDHRR